MMNGITLLNTIEVTTGAWGWSWLGLLFGIVGIGLFIILIVAVVVDTLDASAMLGFIFCGFCFAGAVTSFAEAIPVFDHYEYQVTIDNNVSLQEFNQKYEIVKQEGKIYTIKEKESFNND